MKCIYVKNYPFDDSYTGGARAHITGIANGFVDVGADVSFITDMKITGIRAKQEIVIDYQRKKKDSPRSFDQAVYKALVKTIGDNHDNYKFMYSRMRPDAMATMRASKTTGVPYATEYNSSAITGWREVQYPHIMKTAPLWKKIVAKIISPIRVKHLDRNEMRILSNAKLIVAVSDILADELVHRGIKRENVIVCTNGVDPSVFINNEAAGKRIRDTLGISHTDIVVGFSGTFGKWHGIPEITEAIDRLHGYKDLSFMLIGDGMMKAEMYKKLKDYTNVHFVGFAPFSQMPSYLSACDILLIANSWKASDDKPFFGSPTKMFEYMSMGKAIVASDLTQIGEVFSDGVNCVKFVPGDSASLTKAITKAINDPSLRVRIGKSAREEAVAKYSWRIVADRIIKHVMEK